MGKRTFGIGWAICLILFLLHPVQSFAADEQARAPYGVFVGMVPEQALQLSGFDLLIIDASYFSRAEVAALHQRFGKVYSYLNIGALENTRDYYEDYQDLALAPYENWSEEFWVDVTDARWQQLVEKLAEQLIAKDIDGFFLDNADVYWQYPRDDVYQALLSILKRLKQTGLPVIINGGSPFVEEVLRRGDLDGQISGVNQETVFTTIRFEDETFDVSEPENRDFYLDYLARCEAAGLQVYLLEYGAEPEALPGIERFCAEHGYMLFNAQALFLDHE